MLNNYDTTKWLCPLLFQFFLHIFKIEVVVITCYKNCCLHKFIPFGLYAVILDYGYHTLI